MIIVIEEFCKVLKYAGVSLPDHKDPNIRGYVGKIEKHIDVYRFVWFYGVHEQLTSEELTQFFRVVNDHCTVLGATIRLTS